MTSHPTAYDADFYAWTQEQAALLRDGKWPYQPDKRVRGHSWQDTIREQRRRLSRRLSQNPSLRPMLPTVLAESYPYVRQRASLQTQLPVATFPQACPWTVAQVLDDDFWLDA